MQVLELSVAALPAALAGEWMGNEATCTQTDTPADIFSLEFFVYVFSYLTER